MEYSTETKDVTLYGFDRETKELTNPFSYTWVVGTGIAANSTLKKPPIYEEGFIPIFKDGEWVVVENHFGKTSYSTTDKTPTVVDYYGEIKVGYTLLEPKNFDSWNGEVWLDQRTEQEKYNTYLSSLKPLSRRQFKLALLENDLLTTIDTAINSISDPSLKARIEIEYTEATEFVRTSESVRYMISMLELSDEQANLMWETAQNL